MGSGTKWMAVSVTTMEALKKCIQEEILLFSIEDPLYTALQDMPHWREDLYAYHLEDNPEGRWILARKIRGSSRFDEEQYEVYYTPME